MGRPHPALPWLRRSLHTNRCHLQVGDKCVDPLPFANLHDLGPNWMCSSGNQPERSKTIGCFFSQVHTDIRFICRICLCSELPSLHNPHRTMVPSSRVRVRSPSSTSFACFGGRPPVMFCTQPAMSVAFMQNSAIFGSTAASVGAVATSSGRRIRCFLMRQRWQRSLECPT